MPSGSGLRGLTAGTRNAFVAVGAVLLASVLLGEGLAAAAIPGVGGLRGSYILRLGIAVFAPDIDRAGRSPCASRRCAGASSRSPWAWAACSASTCSSMPMPCCSATSTPTSGSSRGFANVIVIPFLAIATARNTGWTVDLHLSRGASYSTRRRCSCRAHSCCSSSGAGYFVRYFGGEWGRALQIELLFAAALVVVLVAFVGTLSGQAQGLRQQAFLFVPLRLSRGVAAFHAHALDRKRRAGHCRERTIMALADLVESPGGMLLAEGGGVAAIVPVGTLERPGDRRIGAIRRRARVIPRANGLDREHSRTARGARALCGSGAPGMGRRRFPPRGSSCRLPPCRDSLGFVVLTAPRTAVDVDWEVRDLLKTASRQAASYLGHVRAIEALLEARKFDAFNRMSAFVVHDLKNLVSQLSLMLKNAERHRDNPEFQSDMLLTVEHVVERMNALMLQLRIGRQPRRECAPGRSRQRRAARLRSEIGSGRVPIEFAGMPATALGHEQRLEHVIGHLLQNAIDASRRRPIGQRAVSSMTGRSSSSTVVG